MTEEDLIFTTASGKRMSAADVDRLAEQAERGFDIDQLEPVPSRSQAGRGFDSAVTIRLTEDLHRAAVARADAESVSLSQVARWALQAFLASGPASGSTLTVRGRTFTNAELDAMADEAEAGYDPSSLEASTPTQPTLTHEVTIRLPKALAEAVEVRASSEQVSTGAIVRIALEALLRGAPAPPPPGGGAGTSSSDRSELPEARTRRALILPQLREAGWGDDQIVEEFRITDGRIIPVGARHRRERPVIADYVLQVDGVPVAVVEAKKSSTSTADGVGQAKVYARLLDLPLAFASNGHVTVRVDLANGQEDFNVGFPTPSEAWAHFTAAKNLTPESARAYTVPYNRDLRNTDGSVKTPRYCQRTAINRTVERVLRGDKRLLVVMATGTGKSFLAMQIVWKLQKSGWVDGRRPRVLYLADRNILIDQPRLREFVPAFGENSIHKFAGEMKTGRDIYFGLYQNLGSGDEAWYRQYPADFFDAIVVDECHRGSSTADSAWRRVLEYFAPATQIGLTATPVVHDEADTYRYFGAPIYEYSLAQGIEDGFLAPYTVRRVVLSADAFGFVPEEGELDMFGEEIPAGLYEAPQFERVVSLLSRTETAAAHLTNYLKQHGRYGKTVIFCVNSDHADAMRRAMHNANSDITADDPDYVVRIVSAEYEHDRLLAEFADPERRSPTIATTSQLLSTGVDIPSIRNVVLFRTIGSMSLFKQIIGRGTRLDPDTEKWQFEIIDYCGASKLFEDPEFDGPALVETEEEIDETGTVVSSQDEVNEPEVDEPASPDAEPDVAELDHDETVKKFYVEDEPVWVVAEGVFRLDPATHRPRLVEYRSFVADVVRELAPTATELRSRWAGAVSRRDVIDALAARGIELAEAIEQTGLAEADPLDLLVHLAWNEPLATRFDRVRRVRSERAAFFEAFSAEARAVLDELLDKYAAYGPDQLAAASLQVPPISEMGSPVELARRFGGPAALRDAIAALETELYAA